MRKCFIIFKATLFFVKWLQRIKDSCINLKGKLMFLYNQQKSHNHQTKCNKKAMQHEEYSDSFKRQMSAACIGF